MSALGQKQTFAPQQVMSALLPIATRKSGYLRFVMSAFGGKADMCVAIRDVRFGLIADISISRTCCTAVDDWRRASTVSCAADQPADPRSVNIHAPCPSSSGKRARRSAPSGLVAIPAPASIVLIADNDRTLML
jgi:hypothetical protein